MRVSPGRSIGVMRVIMVMIMMMSVTVMMIVVMLAVAVMVTDLAVHGRRRST
jgi:hypothetical protein